MEYIESFRNMAELGITIVGFSALITVLQKRQVKWDYTDKVNLIRFLTMLEQGLVLVFACYLPVVLINYFDEAFTFRISSFLLGISAITYMVIAAKRNIKITGKLNVVKNVTQALWLSAFIYILFCFANVLGMLGHDFGANYLSLMYFQIFFAVLLFMRLIYSTVNIPGNPDERD